MTVILNHKFEQAEREYNPENDMPASGPQVTWVDKALLVEVRYLAGMVASLEKRIDSLERSARNLADLHP